jgi:hypothetical protein
MIATISGEQLMNNARPAIGQTQHAKSSEDTNSCCNTCKIYFQVLGGHLSDDDVMA